jgi:hypothetical protein
MKIEDTRGYKAGIKEAEATIENVHLMYQNRTAINYLEGLIIRLGAELNRRNFERQ